MWQLLKAHIPVSQRLGIVAAICLVVTCLTNAGLQAQATAPSRPRPGAVRPNSANAPVEEFLRAVTARDYAATFDRLYPVQRALNSKKAEAPQSMWPDISSGFYRELRKSLDSLADGNTIGPFYIVRPIHMAWIFLGFPHNARILETRAAPGDMMNRPSIQTFVSLAFPSPEAAPLVNRGPFYRTWVDRLKKTTLKITRDPNTGLIDDIVRVENSDEFWPGLRIVGLKWTDAAISRAGPLLVEGTLTLSGLRGLATVTISCGGRDVNSSDPGSMLGQVARELNQRGRSLTFRADRIDEKRLPLQCLVAVRDASGQSDAATFELAPPKAPGDNRHRVWFREPWFNAGQWADAVTGGRMYAKQIGILKSAVGSGLDSPSAELPKAAVPSAPRSEEPAAPAPGATLPVPPTVGPGLAPAADPRLFYRPTKSLANALEDFGTTAPADRNAFPHLVGYATGINFAGPGEAVAAADGRVVRVVDLGRKDKDFGFGNTVILEHILESGDTLYSLYANLAAISSGVGLGQMLTRGTVIGPIGSSGQGRDKYWISQAASPRCVSASSAILIRFCVRLHFELKRKPVLENPSADLLCRTKTLLGSKPSLCYGYSPQDPTELGYVDPRTVLGRVRVKPANSPSAPPPAVGGVPAVPATADPRERWDRFIASESQAITKFPTPARDWRAMASLALTRRTDSYEELYLSAVNRRNLAADALVNVSEFVRKGDFESATNWALSYSRINQESNNLFNAAANKIAGAAVDVGRSLEIGYQVLKHSSQIGFLAACGTNCYEVAGYVFLVTDYGVDYSMRGRDEATRSLVAGLAAQTILQQKGLAAWMDSRSTQLIGRSGLYSQLGPLLQDPQLPAQIMKAVAAHGVSELSVATVKEIVLATSRAVARSRSLEPSEVR